MNRAFFLNILFLLFINFLIKPFYIFGIDRTIQNRVGLEEYGLYATLFNFAFLLQIINDFGIQNFNNRNIAQHNQLLPKYFPNILVLKFGLSLIYTVLTFIAAFFLGYGSRHFHLLCFLGFNQIILSFIFFFRSNISGLGFYRTDSIITVLDRLILIIICSALLWGNLFEQAFQIEWFVYAQSFSLSITALISFLIIYQKLPYLKLQFKPAFLLLIIKKSYPFALAIFLMTIYTRLDFIMIERLLPEGEKEAGIYASAYRLLDAVNMIGLLFAGLLLPMSARLLIEKKSIRPLLRLSLQLIMCGVISLALASIIYREEIMFLLYKDASIYAAQILGILMLCFIIMSAVYIYGTLLTANNSLRELNRIFAISVALNILFNFLLIPQYGALGAACTTFFTQLFAFFYQLLAAKKAFKLQSDYVLLGRFFLLGILILGIGFYLKGNVALIWWWNYALLLLIGMALGFALKLLNIKGMLMLLKEKGGQLN
jgi:O-antigen/teichoic acid export membrane protein